MQYLCPIKRNAGFTLLELLIAITIFTTISMIAYGGMKSVLDTEQQTSEYIDRLSRLQLCLHLIQRDIEQAVARGVRNEFGDTLDAMQGGVSSSLLLEFSRGGYPNPMQLRRSSLQRVGYLLEDGVLYRVTWKSLDRAPDESPIRSQLLDNILSIEIIYYDQRMKPANEWPTSNQLDENSDPSPLPRAIEITLELKEMGIIRRLFRVFESSSIPS
jgi:general secretion pathway protein J